MQKHLEETLKLKEVPRAEYRPQAKPLSYYPAHNQTSKETMVKAYAAGYYNVNMFGDYSTVSRAIKKVDTRHAWLQDLTPFFYKVTPSHPV